MPVLVWMVLVATIPFARVAEGLQTAHGQAFCVPSAYDPSVRPDPDGTPTTISIGLYVVDLVSIKDVEQTFTVDYGLNLRWSDPRLAHRESADTPERCTADLQQVWHPHLTSPVIRETRSDYPDLVEIAADGRVSYFNRFFSTVSSPFHLEDFPFDRQALTISFVSELYGPEELTFDENERAMGRADTFTIAGWTVQSWKTRRSTYHYVPERNQLAQFDFVLDVVRRSGYFVVKIILPLVLLVVMSWAVFWLDPRNPGPQTAVAATVMLTLIVYLHRVGDVLPPIAYLTRLDRFLIWSLGLGFLAFGEAVISSFLARGGKEAPALRLDRWSRWLFPIGLALILLASFGV